MSTTRAGPPAFLVFEQADWEDNSIPGSTNLGGTYEAQEEGHSEGSGRQSSQLAIFDWS